MTPNPYRIEGPAMVSFSGGRTSGFMLHQIVQAHGGALPADVHVAFANTGKEREETLRFVYECGSRWGVRIRWVEWRDTRREYLAKTMAAAETFEEVGFNSASRNGEPFEALIRSKSYLPNWQARFCTQYLKVEPMTAFARSIGLVPGTYAEVIGLRADEPWRVAKMKGRNIDDGRKCLAPLHTAGITKADVMAFWAQQPFDLGLEPWEGNCDLCFLKGRGIRKRIIRDEPRRAEWWAGMEAQTGGFFDRRDRYAALVKEVRRTPELFDAFDPEDDHDAECGLYCGPPDELEAAE